MLESQWSVMKRKRKTLSWESGERKVYPRFSTNFSLIVRFCTRPFLSHSFVVRLMGAPHPSVPVVSVELWDLLELRCVLGATLAAMSHASSHLMVSLSSHHSSAALQHGFVAPAPARGTEAVVPVCQPLDRCPSIRNFFPICGE